MLSCLDEQPYRVVCECHRGFKGNRRSNLLATGFEVMLLVCGAMIAGSGVYKDGSDWSSPTLANLVSGAIYREDATLVIPVSPCKVVCIVCSSRIALTGSHEMSGSDGNRGFRSCRGLFLFIGPLPKKGANLVIIGS